jgi:hypothetical protein
VLRAATSPNRARPGSEGWVSHGTVHRIRAAPRPQAASGLDVQVHDRLARRQVEAWFGLLTRKPVGCDSIFGAYTPTETAIRRRWPGRSSAASLPRTMSVNGPPVPPDSLSSSAATARTGPHTTGGMPFNP